MNRQLKEHLCGLIKESKIQAKKGNIVQSLKILESLPKEILSPDNDIGWRMTSQMATYCHKLASSSASKSEYLSRSEVLLMNWICTCHNSQIPVKEKIIKLLLQNIHNWSMYHCSTGSKSLALGYLLKHLSYIETIEAKKPSTYRLMASIRYKASSLYIELGSYKEAVAAGEDALSFLQKENLLSGGTNEVDSLPIYVSCFYNIGTAQKKLGKRKAAAEAFEIASRSSKNLPTGHNLVKYVMKPPQKRNSVTQRRDKKLCEGEMKFLKNDDCFYNKIGSLLKMSTKLISKPHILQMRVDKEERKSLSQLRLRKHHRKVDSGAGNLGRVKKEIDRLKERDEVEAKLSKVKLKSQNLASKRRLYREKFRSQPHNKVYSPVPISGRSSFLAVTEAFESLISDGSVAYSPNVSTLSGQCSLAKSTLKSNSIDYRNIID